MASAEEFRDYADECLGWAKTAKSDREREIFLQMARTWLEAAAIASGKITGAKSAIQPEEIQYPTVGPSALDAE
jgi:hypothetical protein